MRVESTAFVLFACSVAVLALTGHAVTADGLTLEDMAEDIVPVEIQLNVNYQMHHSYLAGDPPTVARGSTSISFRRSAVYTFVRFKEGYGMHYAAFPGFLAAPQFTPVSGISVYQTHTCHDDQMFIIGRESRDLSASAEVHPASGDILLSRVAEGPGERVRIGVGIWQVETEHIRCPTQPFCFDERTFHFDGPVGEDRDAWVETGDGDQQYQGIELAVVDWSLLRSLADGGEVPLVIPVSAVHTQQSGERDPNVDTITEVYTVTGVIAPVVELPLEPLVP